jgi:tight adherence protein B
LAAENMMDRLPSEELRVLMTAILVQRRVGGNLAKALSETSHTIAERQKLNDEIRTMTAEARYSSYIIPLLPIAILLLMRNTMPEFVEPLFNNPIGWIILAVFGGMQILAFVIIQRLSDIRV